MKQFLLTFFLLTATSVAMAQAVPSPSPQRPANPVPVQQREGAAFEISDYGVTFQADTRLILVMAALEAAGFDPNPGKEPSVFRAKVEKDLAGLDPELRTKMKTFYERNRLPAPATPADQVARYVSLALALTPAPQLEAPERSEDLPAGLLDVLDFAPLVREFHRRSGIEDHLVDYVRAYQSEGDRLLQPTAEMVRSVLTYLHTRPLTTTLERVEVRAPGTKKKNQKTYSTRQKDRRFIILPDLLAPRGAINFRIIGDDYYAIVPEGTDPTSSELRRAYLQYVIDALVLRFNKEIALHRDQIKQVLDDRQKAGTQVSADVFLTVGRSLVAAADARYDEARRLELLGRSARAQLVAAKDDPARTAIVKSAEIEIAAIQDETVARLADEYEKGAVLSFFFSDQLKGIETAGFDIANFFPDMLSTLDPARETKRPSEYAEIKQRALAAREARLAARKAEADAAAANEANNPRDAALVKELAAIEETLRTKNYNDAETRLKNMLRTYPGEARIFFALGQTASLAAMDATDDTIQAERLNRALGQYRLAIQASSPELDKAILSRAHESMGRINAFLDNKVEAIKEFDEAIKIGNINGGAYQQALDGKRKLAQP
ncbi:MAG TPA: hypothetical protein VI306_11700 [Pyrinomonadaceae bacterium]